MEEQKVDIICEENSDSLRLDQFLLMKYPDLSRSYFQEIIEQGLVFVNAKKALKSYRPKPGDAITISFPGAKKVKVEPQDVQFDIVSSTKDFLIINKPAGLTVHHTKEWSSDPTLVSGLLYRFKELHGVGESDRPGIVHRLDKFTSGLMVVALNTKSLIEFARMFRERKVRKTYLAVVNGHPEPEGMIDFSIGRHPVERTKMSHASYDGRPALTYYKVLSYFKKTPQHGPCALVEARPITGRTHQIRVHFAAIGHGLVGDTMYGSTSKVLNRQALHAWKLSFEYGGETFDYCVPIPEDFKKLLRELKA